MEVTFVELKKKLWKCSMKTKKKHNSVIKLRFFTENDTTLRFYIEPSYQNSNILELPAINTKRRQLLELVVKTKQNFAVRLSVIKRRPFVLQQKLTQFFPLQSS